MERVRQRLRRRRVLRPGRHVPQGPARWGCAGERKLPPLGSAGKGLDSQPLTGRALRGKVVLVDFWTYSCINWQRQLPYVRAWAKFVDPGVEVFAFTFGRCTAEATC